MAPDVLLALVEAGVVLWVDDGRLRFRAPEGAFGEELRARAAACRGALLVLVKAGAVLPADLARWPEDASADREERAAIIEFDGGLPRDAAEREAERCVRLEHARAFVARAALRSAP